MSPDHTAPDYKRAREASQQYRPSDYEPSLMPLFLDLCFNTMPSNSSKPQNPPNTPAWDVQTRNKNSTNHKTGPPLPRHYLKQQSSSLQNPLSNARPSHFSFVIHLSPSGFVHPRRMGSCQYRKHVIHINSSPSLRLSPPRQVAQVKRAEGMCRAAGWTSQSWPAVHLSTRGKSRPQGASR